MEAHSPVNKVNSMPQEKDLSVERVDAYRAGAVRSLWNLTHYFNVLNKDRWTREVDEELYKVRRDLYWNYETSTLERPDMKSAKFLDCLTHSHPCQHLHLIYTKDSRNLTYYFHFSVTPHAPPFADIISGSPLCRRKTDSLISEVRGTNDKKHPSLPPPPGL